MQNGTAILEDSLAVSHTLHVLSLCDPTITLLGIYLKKLKNRVHIQTCTWGLIEALFIIAQTWKQPICPSAGEWINCGTPRQGHTMQQ